MVLGSVDFLGNPIGVLNHVGLGITEFVSEVGDGHLAGGVASLAQHVAFGLADGASKITGSISSGLGKASDVITTSTAHRSIMILLSRERTLMWVHRLPRDGSCRTAHTPHQCSSLDVCKQASIYADVFANSLLLLLPPHTDFKGPRGLYGKRELSSK